MKHWEFEGYDEDRSNWVLLHKPSMLEASQFSRNKIYTFEIKSPSRKFFDTYRFLQKDKNSAGTYQMGVVQFDIFGLFRVLMSL